MVDPPHNLDPYLRTIADTPVHYIFGRPETEPILRSFINAVFTNVGLPEVKRVEVKNPFKIGDFPTEKDAILDVLAECDNKEIVNLEFQVAKKKAFRKRCLHYNYRVYSSQLKEGESYEKTKPVYSIVLTDFLLFPELDRPYASFMLREDEFPELVFSGDTRFLFLQMPKDFRAVNLRKINKVLLAWLKYFGFPDRVSKEEWENLGKENEGLDMAVKTYSHFVSDEDLRDLARRRDAFWHDVATEKESQLSEAFAKGEARGEAKGEARGITKGRTDMLLFSLAGRFGSLPTDLATKLGTLTDESEIYRLLNIAFTVSTLEEFTKNL